MPPSAEEEQQQQQQARSLAVALARSADLGVVGGGGALAEADALVEALLLRVDELEILASTLGGARGGDGAERALERKAAELEGLFGALGRLVACAERQAAALDRAELALSAAESRHREHAVDAYGAFGVLSRRS